ncbi:ABC transporter permease subunit [Verrucomicrobiaceae bacterium N1E253]|uniref:ABC transporter permease subunit n=1 Tax=Oceaniferula marina TaxID=2748318 RepID=A0A851GN85_9BACT|nr:carbohydrate ABC transporter permease [Oceaniferula marina]NWK56595.1 ABC transporter permease subunit [Oceaniferula marina]
MPKLRHPAWSRLAQKAWLWALLLGGAAIFLFPFLWMIVSSVKTGEEVNQQTFWPELPEFRNQSPYVIESPLPPRPNGCDELRWQIIQPELTTHCSELIAADPARPRLLKSSEEKENFIQQASQYLLQRGLKKMPEHLWQHSSDSEIQQAFITALAAGNGQDAELQKAYANTYARLIIHGLKVRAEGAGVIYQSSFKKQPTTDELPTGLSLDESTSGNLAYDSDGQLVLQSHFSSSSDSSIVLHYQFTIPKKAGDIHRIIIPMTYDASWHQLHAQLKINGTSYQGTRSTWLAESKASSLTLQLGKPDSEDWGKRPWIPMQAIGDPQEGSGALNHITLTLTLDPSSTTVARAGKIQRNYQRVFLSMPFWKYIINSILITTLSILGAVLSSSFVAYAFARLRWPGRSIAFVILLSTMMLPPQVTMIPQFLIWREIGWYNTLNPIWVPTWFGIAFFIFLMVQQMKSIPRDLEEAAEIDGMNPLQTWYYVIVPLVKPAMAAIAIMSFMASWNEFMAPLVYLRDMGRFPLSVGIYAMAADETMTHDMPLILAGNLLMTLPVIIIFFFCQRYFIQGVSSAGVKG